MAFLEETEGKIVLGIAIGVLAAGLAKRIAPAYRGLGRPLLKASVKAGLTVYEQARMALAELGETIEDVVAEVRAERELEAQRPGENAAPAHPLGGAVQ